MTEMAAGDSAASPSPTSSRAANSSPKDSVKPETRVAVLHSETPPITTSRRE